MKLFKSKQSMKEFMEAQSKYEASCKPLPGVYEGVLFDKDLGLFAVHVREYSYEGNTMHAVFAKSLETGEYAIGCGHPFLYEPEYQDVPDEFKEFSFGIKARFKKDVGCAFNMRISRTGKACKHLAGFFDVLRENLIIDQILDAVDGVHKQVKKKENGGEIEENLLAYAGKIVGFKGRAIAMVGPAGTGKSKSAKEWAKAVGATFIKFDCAADHEPIDLFAQLTYAIDGSKTWKMGPIALAAKEAQEGKKVVLFLDEFLNLPKRTQGALKAGFEPDEGKYRFETGRALPSGEPEVVEIPVQNLQIIAAANTGGSYSSYEFEKALKQRFFVLDYKKNWERIKKILLKEIAAKGWGAHEVEKLISFGKLVDDFYHQDLFIDECSLRHLLDLVRFSERSEDMADVARLHRFQWIDFESATPETKEEMEVTFEDILSKTLEV